MLGKLCPLTPGPVIELALFRANSFLPYNTGSSGIYPSIKYRNILKAFNSSALYN